MRKAMGECVRERITHPSFICFVACAPTFLFLFSLLVSNKSSILFCSIQVVSLSPKRSAFITT